MADVDVKLKELYREILETGERRGTETGTTLSLWDRHISFDLSEEFPAVTSKKLAWKSCVGELLFFLSGLDTIGDLQYFTFRGVGYDKWTIWTGDAERWGRGGYLGRLYPQQWRNSGAAHPTAQGVDQIQNLVYRLKNQPNRRDHIVMAWCPYDIENDLTALKPCHIGFQCYVSNGKLNLKWWQRSVDSFLGLPFNIASYALLTHLLAKWTGLEVGILSCDLGDVHLYENHVEAVKIFLNNPRFKPCQLELPEGTESLESTLELTALDFAGSLKGYNSMGSVKAPLSVDRKSLD